MSVYLVAQITIEDRERYSEYEAGFLDIFMQYEGRIVAVDEATEVLEGDWPATRTVIAEFSSAEAAHAWFDSPEYQTLAAHRKAASVGHIALVNGL